MPTIRLASALVVTIGLCGMLACQRDPSIEEACTELAKSSCELLQRCDPDTLNRVYGDSATCTVRQQLGCTYQFPANSRTTTQSFVDCAHALSAAACSQVLVNQAVVLTNLTACRPQPGGQSNGTLCYADSQCQSTFCNKGTLGGLCGACAKRAAVDEDCNATACDYGLICAQQGGQPNRCVPASTAALGESCDQTARCQAGLICVGQKCAATLKAGDACIPGQGSDACDRPQGLYCDQNAQRCAATQYVKAGQACGGGAQNQRTTCSGSSRCINDQICLGPAGDGQSTVYSCLPPAIAANRVCTLPDPKLCM